MTYYLTDHVSVQTIVEKYVGQRELVAHEEDASGEVRIEVLWRGV